MYSLDFHPDIHQLFLVKLIEEAIINRPIHVFPYLDENGPIIEYIIDNNERIIIVGENMINEKEVCNQILLEKHDNIANKIRFICRTFDYKDKLTHEEYEGNKIKLKTDTSGNTKLWIKEIGKVFDTDNNDWTFRRGLWIDYLDKLYRKAIEIHNKKEFTNRSPVDDSKIFGKKYEI